VRPLIRVTATVVIVGAVASPALRDRDSFPLSTYPVYADVRPRTAEFVTAVGVLLDGNERRLSMDVLASTDDPLVAQQRLTDGLASDAAALCTRIAERAPDDVFEVIVVSERHDIVRAATGDPSQLDRTIHARCRTDR
jgi:hypothetical protein